MSSYSECLAQQERRRKMLNKIQFVRPPYDPLVINLNRNQYWIVDGFGLTCNWLLKVDKELFDEGEPYFPNPHLYHKVKHLTLKIKHAIVEI